MKAYAWEEVNVLINSILMDEFGQGDDAIRARRLVKSQTSKVGIGGNMVVSLSADKSGEVILRLLQTSNSNSFLSVLLASTESGVLIPLTLQIKDLLGSDIVIGTIGYIEQPADFVRGGEDSDMEWVLVFETLTIIYGLQDRITAGEG